MLKNDVIYWSGIFINFEGRFCLNYKALETKKFCTWSISFKYSFFTKYCCNISSFFHVIFIMCFSYFAVKIKYIYFCVNYDLWVSLKEERKSYFHFNNHMHYYQIFLLLNAHSLCISFKVHINSWILIISCQTFLHTK